MAPIEAYISVATASTDTSKDYITAAYPYIKQKWPSFQQRLAVFFLELTSGSTLTSHRRLTYTESSCVAVRTFTDGTVYLLIKTGD